TSDELFNTNITNVTTATAVALELAADGEITTAEALEAAQVLIDGSLILPFATAIKLVIDYAGSNPDLALPDTVADTFALISDQEAIYSYISYAKDEYSDSYTVAQDAILEDSTLIDSSLGESSLVGTFYVASSDGSSYVSGYQLILNNDNTGVKLSHERQATGSGESELTWSIDSGSLTLNYAEEDTFSYYYTIDPAVGNVTADYTLSSTEMNIVSEFEHSLLVKVVDFTLIEYPNGEYDSDTEESIPLINSITKSSGILDAAGVLEMGVEYALSIPILSEVIEAPDNLNSLNDSEVTYGHVYAVFSGEPNTGGDVILNYPQASYEGNTTYNQVTATWYISDIGQLIIDYIDGYIESNILSYEDNTTPIASVLIEEETNNFKISDSGRHLKRISAWTEDNIVGIYALNLSYLDDPNDVFWIELYEDGTGLQVNTRSGTEQITSYTVPILWQLQDSGILSIRRYRDADRAVCESEVFDPTPQDICNLYHERELDLFSIKTVNDQLRVHTLNTHKYFNDYRVREHDISYTEHALSLQSSRERYWLKLDERPVEIDISSASNLNVGFSDSSNIHF
ncbi:hypothetical protein, partial [Paraglaciecola marina]|uniref:hypothetical protein n=1 Tax=Paraglaciecola marina TaxID=2500157 RepID=UPI001414E1D8